MKITKQPNQVFMPVVTVTVVQTWLLLLHEMAVMQLKLW
jgi:hypothetical protein